MEKALETRSGTENSVRDVHKVRPIRSQVCRTTLIRSALESSDLGTFNGGSNVKIRPLGSNLVTFEVAGAPSNSEFF